MEIKNLKDRVELIENYKNLDEEDKNILDSSYEIVIDTNACASRVEELREFCKKMNYKKIGIAFCKGLRKYGEKLDEMLSEDFEVCSVCCNIGSLKRDEINAPKMTDSAEELACNPLGEANILNDAKVDFAIMVGFCLGHEQLFQKNIKSPTTTLIVKDRKWKHNAREELE